ncbi:unnamed protein product [Arabidopsis halleri]
MFRIVQLREDDADKLRKAEYCAGRTKLKAENTLQHKEYSIFKNAMKVEIEKLREREGITHHQAENAFSERN